MLFLFIPDYFRYSRQFYFFLVLCARPSKGCCCRLKFSFDDHMCDFILYLHENISCLQLARVASTWLQLNF